MPRHMRSLNEGNVIFIPEEICNSVAGAILRKGTYVKQTCDGDRIVLYCPDAQASLSDVDELGEKCKITLKEEYVARMGVQVGAPLYFSVLGDLINIEKAYCEKCKTEDDLYEYEMHEFMCRKCIAKTIQTEKDRRK